MYLYRRLNQRRAAKSTIRLTPASRTSVMRLMLTMTFSADAGISMTVVLGHIHHNAWQQTARAPGKPTKQQSVECAEYHLHSIQMDDSKDECRYHDGHPRTIAIRKTFSTSARRMRPSPSTTHRRQRNTTMESTVPSNILAVMKGVCQTLSLSIVPPCNLSTTTTQMATITGGDTRSTP